MTKMEKAGRIALGLAGYPYIFGAYGQICTPSYRKQVMKNKPSYAEKIERYCPVLSGKQSACTGCQYNGKESFDCRGLTWYALDAVGIKIGRVGATTQWKTDSWKEKGTIDQMPKDRPAIVFRADGDVMQHTGFRLADGRVIDSRGHAYGVLVKDQSNYKWTHYAIPYGADDVFDAPQEQEGDSSMPATYKRVSLKTSKYLNLRAAPGTDSEAIGSVPNGEVVEVLTGGDWPFIRYTGKSGYVSGQYLVDDASIVPPEPPTASQTVSGRMVIKDSKGNTFVPDGSFTVSYERE